MNLGSRENIERELEKIKNNPNDINNKKINVAMYFYLIYFMQIINI